MEKLIFNVYFKGLLSLDMDKVTSDNVGKHSVEEQKECDPMEAIPLHYTPLHPKTLSKDKTHTQSTLSDTLMDYNDSVMLSFNTSSNTSWHSRSKALLLKKASVVYYGITNTFISCQQYANALRSVHVALYSFCKYLGGHFMCLPIKF